MIVRFMTFLREGGGRLKTPSGHVAQGIDTSTPQKRRAAREDVHGFLSSVHDHMQKHGVDLFKDRLITGQAYSGSSKHLMNKKISDTEFSQHKPMVGDADVKIDKKHKDALLQHIQPGQRHGNYHIEAVHKKGEVHVLARHATTGHIHQFDFEPLHDPDDKFADFSKSSSWEDSKAHPEFKGKHHKILLNAAAGETHKFALQHGLKSRTDDSAPGIKDTKQITRTLFGKTAKESDLHSFVGLTRLIKKHVPAHKHQAIIDSFSAKESPDHPAVKHLKKELQGLNEETKKEEEIHHISVFHGGTDPSTHSGHIGDVKKLHKQTGSKKIIWSSSEKGTTVYSPKEKEDIVRRQWKDKDIHPMTAKSIGQAARVAHDSLPKGSKKVLHLIGGADRSDYLLGFADALHKGKIKEMGTDRFHEVHVHLSPAKRKHGMSGTKYRTAAEAGDIETFHKHLGPEFSREEAQSHMKRVQRAIKSGKLKVKRYSK